VYATTLVILAVFIVVVIVTLSAFALRLNQLESRFVDARAVRDAEPVVPALQAESVHPLGVDWLVEGYCVKDRKKVEMMNPHPVTLKNGTPATEGVCPDCGTKIFKISRSYAVVEARARVPEDRERIPRGRREMA
jgi:hypothetical protein